MHRHRKYQQLSNESTTSDEQTTSYHERAITHTITKNYEDNKEVQTYPGYPYQGTRPRISVPQTPIDGGNKVGSPTFKTRTYDVSYVSDHLFEIPPQLKSSIATPLY